MGHPADTKLPLLDATMRLCKASNESLALVSGVAARTIGSARRGKPIRRFLADIISETLYTHEFSYEKRGRKPQKFQQASA